MTTLLRARTFPGEKEIQLLQGDITLVEADGVVNPANSQLAHGGGLAGTLSRKAGPALQRESSAWVQEHGPVSHQSPAYTTGGALPFQAVIHAVGPVWGSGQEEHKLRAAVWGSLEKAQELGLTSLALPAISTGIFGYPLQPAAEVILSTVFDFAGQSPQGELKRIFVVLYGQAAGTVFAQVWDRIQP